MIEMVLKGDVGSRCDEAVFGVLEKNRQVRSRQENGVFQSVAIEITKQKFGSGGLEFARSEDGFRTGRETGDKEQPRGHREFDQAWAVGHR